MSVHAIDRLCYDIAHEPGTLERLRADPRRELADRPLTADERDELLRGDVAALYRRGAHPVLLVRLAAFRVLGLDPALYAARIRAAEPRFSVPEPPERE
ncbi:hypothetical protein CP980_33415 [Streptomyces vinaceus]|uniref:Uncharacterized protein n=1 Tax=Streptomyces vinaceus TaxID=1960 RepID=A0A5J6JEL7_STRVI|nr:hypothetical protein [Streptomyces vinaceus]QEV49320.1 hypothetical protein CP980_33415 [Streptomyces vinaceus]GHE44406.1 hypothetical protein GCM10017778_29810 [Streptomyces vinaceus]